LRLTLQARAAIASRPPTVRSRSTNDHLFIFGLDGRTAEARRVRDLIAMMVDALGGKESATDEEKSLAREAAFAIASSERTQARILRGEQVDLKEASRLANIAARYRKDVRLRQKAKAGTPKPMGALALHFANPPAREARE